MPVSASEMMPKPEVLSSDITALIGGALGRAQHQAAGIRHAEGVALAATTWTATAEPRPSLMVSSMSSSA